MRCPVCTGLGKLDLKKLPEMVLYEWIKGYMDTATDDEWLAKCLERLLVLRKKERGEHCSNTTKDESHSVGCSAPGNDECAWYGDWVAPPFED